MLKRINTAMMLCAMHLPFYATLGQAAEIDCSMNEDIFEGEWEAVSASTAVSPKYQLCKDQELEFEVRVAPGQWTMLELGIDGTGRGETDLDFYQLGADGKAVWKSTYNRPFEQLAWYNAKTTEVTKTLRVKGFKEAAAGFRLKKKVTGFHKLRDCEKAFPSYDIDDPKNPCNHLLAFPQAADKAEGYYVEHATHYSFLRRELIYLIRHAASETYKTFPGTKPLALMDMSERDGETPGTSVNDLRHPRGTHRTGNDIDIAYFQTDGINNGQVVCENDKFYCTKAPHILDATRTAFFIVQLLRAPHTRVVGVDPMVYTAIVAASEELERAGTLLASDLELMRTKIAYGEGWPFHHHHLHFSWNWEGFDQLESNLLDRVGCGIGHDRDPYEGLDPAKF